MSSTEKSGWSAEAAALANRYAVATGVAVTFVLFGLIVVPALVRERRKPSPAPSDQPAAPSAGWLDPADAPASPGKELPPVDPETVLTPNPKLMARGAARYQQHCSSCHGDAGRGDGPAASTLNPRPRDFTQPAGWKQGFHVTEIFRTVSSGIRGTGMAAFDFLLPADRMALVHHVRSLGSFDHGAENPAAIEALANQFRSQAVRIPNRIPVSLAIRKLVGEQAPAPPLAWPAADDASASADLLRRVIADPSRVARTVTSTGQREDRDAVARAWVAGAPTNGFAPALAALTADEWGALLEALLGNGSPPPASSQEETKR